MTFRYKGSKYSYTPFPSLKQLPEMKEYKETKYVDMGAAFDIETTSYISEKYMKPMATMWHWQFGLKESDMTERVN